MSYIRYKQSKPNTRVDTDSQQSEINIVQVHNNFLIDALEYDVASQLRSWRLKYLIVNQHYRTICKRTRNNCVRYACTSFTGHTLGGPKFILKDFTCKRKREQKTHHSVVPLSNKNILKRKQSNFVCNRLSSGLRLRLGYCHVVLH